ncbi:hypothetical protein KDX23_30460 [Burkholderia vietnamiensis]|uniref:DUF5440 family protein n=1 Tax=Burkholderia vietnamiensis TaxID=60552 RepID=UPI001B98173B|nr:hypothetical protein [Burkholderia vietnamiensis]MBR8087041.1 hypothetical protein [Burkholderia vietnamiensis]
MNITDAIELPEGLRAEFEVLDHEAGAAGKTWLLRDVASGTKYVLRPSTVAGWKIAQRPARRPAGTAPSIIVANEGASIIAMELRTGRVYRDAAPPTRFSLR